MRRPSAAADSGMMAGYGRGTMAEVAYISNVRIERIKGPLRKAYLPGEPQPVMFSVHGGIAKHYGIDESRLPEPHAATIDYVIAALGG